MERDTDDRCTTLYYIRADFCHHLLFSFSWVDGTAMFSHITHACIDVVNFNALHYAHLHILCCVHSIHCEFFMFISTPDNYLLFQSETFYKISLLWIWNFHLNFGHYYLYGSMKNTTHSMEQMVGQEIGHQRIKKLLIKCSLAQIMSKTIFNGPSNLFGLLVQRIFGLYGSLKFPWIYLFVEKYVESVAFSSKPI